MHKRRGVTRFAARRVSAISLYLSDQIPSDPAQLECPHEDDGAWAERVLTASPSG